MELPSPASTYLSFSSGALRNTAMSSAKKRKLSLCPDSIEFERTSCLCATLQAIRFVPSFSNWIQSDIDHQRNCDKDSCIKCSTFEFKQTKKSTFPMLPVDTYDKLYTSIGSFTLDFEHSLNEFTHSLTESMHETSTLLERKSIEKAFDGTLSLSTKCYSCQHDTFEEIKFTQLTISVENIQSIEEAFANYFALSDLVYECPSCKENVSAAKQLSIKHHPVTLCVQLKRTDDAIVHIRKPSLKIDLSKYSSDHTCSKKSKYRLVSMVTNYNDHHATIGVTRDGAYFLFDGDSVQDISSEYSFFDHSYILFYELLPTKHRNDNLLNEKDPNISNLQRPLKKKMKYVDPKLKHYTLMDLCSNAETCTDFKRIATAIFARSHKFLRFDQGSIKEFVRKRKLVPYMLTNFGALVSGFIIYYVPSSALNISIINTVINYCSENVETLKLTKCNRAHIRLIFKKTFPKLKNFVWICDDDASDFDDFVSRHKSLKTLTIHSSASYIPLLLSITNNCKHLIALDIKATGQRKEFQDNDFENFVTLQKLKRLRMHFPGTNVTKLVRKLKGMKNVNTLEIVDSQADHHLVPALSDLNQLSVLRLVDCSERYLDPLSELVQLTALSIRVKKDVHVELNVVKMIKTLINLETLYIEMDTFAMDEARYLEIVDIVRGSRKHPLEIECAIADKSVYFLKLSNIVKLVWL